VPVTILVLGAGSSTRLGSPKQLVQFQGEALLHRAARVAREVAPTIVVIRKGACAMRDSVRDLDVIIVENAEADEGMASSLRCGVAAATGDVLITLCDQPHVTAEHLRALAESGAAIAATQYKGIAGVPALFASKFRSELMALRGDVGAKRVIEAHRDEVLSIPFELAAFDVDTDAAISL
jgi:molybdenum cofactor cytidylyltransferase